MKRTRKKMLIAGAAIAVFLSIPVVCFAEMISPDVEASRTMTITLAYSDKNTKVPIEGAEIYVSLVGKLEKDEKGYSYNITNEYKASGVNLMSLKTASDSAEAAAKLEQMRNKKGLSCENKVSNNKGRAEFTMTTPGMYLVSQNGWNGNSSKYTEFEPFLVKLPMPDDTVQSSITTWQDHIVLQPKMSIDKLSRSNPDTETHIKTGDDMNMFLYVGIAVICLALMLFMIVRRKRKGLR